MSPHTPAVSAAKEQAASVPGVPFARLVRVELRKAYDTRTGMWLLIAIAGLTVASGVLFTILPEASELTFEQFVSATATPQAYLLPVIGILAVTSDWSQRTGLTTFTLEPRRGRVLAAKVAAVVLMGLFAVVLVLVAAALCNLIGMARGGDGSWDFGGIQGYADLLVLQMLRLFGGLAFGTLLLSSAGAVTLWFVLPLLSSTLFTIIPRLDDAGDWIDATTAQEPLIDGAVSAHEWTQILVTSLWWVVIPLAVGVWRILQTDVRA